MFAMGPIHGCGLASEHLNGYILWTPSYRLVYANAFGYKISSNDAVITFSINTTMPAGPVPVDVIQEEVSVAMTMPALKILHVFLSKLIPKIEEIAGPIKYLEAAIPTDEQLDPMMKAFAQAKFVE
jgi:hypothetical protein